MALKAAVHPTVSPEPVSGVRRRISFLLEAGRSWLALGPAFICAAPGLAVLAGAAASLANGPAGHGGTLWLESVLGSLGLLLLGGGGAVLLGAAAALLIGSCRFPGRGAFELLLAAPLAAPAYVLAYAYGDFLGPAGPMPLALHAQLKTALVYALAFYPYVYLAVRAGMVAQSAAALEAARSLGAGPWRSFSRIILPLARPFIAAGAALALMETAADYGAAAYFGASSLATGVFRAWYSLQSPQLALQISALLLVLAIALLGWERAVRPGRVSGAGMERWRAPPRYQLGFWPAAAASAYCAGLLIFAGGLPLSWLMRLAWLDQSNWGRLAEPLARSLTLAGIGALVTLGLAAVTAGQLQRPSRLARWAANIASSGYAAPGAVLALGVLAWVGWAREAGLLAGLSGTAALGFLLWAYAARFTAAGAQPIAAGLARVSPSCHAAARTLGAGLVARFTRIDLPLAAPSVFAAALIVFVEILKELPATLILRPLDWDTLAVRAHAYAADERLTQAAAPALLITLAGLAPILLLAQRMVRARPGGAA